jgi:hydroxycarboxylate dehydrogenase B
MSGVLVRHEALRALTRSMLLALGSGVDEATIVSDHLVDANLAGHDSHGVGLLPMYVKDRLAGNIRPNIHPVLLREDGVIGLFDGALGYGHVSARDATAWGIARAAEKGVAIVSLRDAYHIARVGTYGEQACAAGLISILFVNVVAGGSQKVAPFGGADGRLHTNPVCIGIPAGSDHPPFVLDFATSEIAMGKVRVAHNEGRQIAAGALIDAEGKPTRDPKVIFEEPLGAIVPFGAHKGSGLALACELLGGALSGGPTNQSTAPRGGGVINSFLAIFIDPARFVELPYFHREIAAVLDHVKASPPASADRPVMTAGEPERARRRSRLAEGIPVDAASWKEILAAAELAGVADATSVLGDSVAYLE